MKRKLVVIIAIIVILLLLLSFPIIFYSKPYLTADQSIRYANNHLISDSDADYIWFDGFKSLQIVDEDLITEETFAKVRSIESIKWNAWNNVTITSKIHVSVTYWESGELINKYQGTRKLNFIFEDFKWKVESVEVID